MKVERAAAFIVADPDSYQGKCVALFARLCAPGRAAQLTRSSMGLGIRSQIAEVNKVQEHACSTLVQAPPHRRRAAPQTEHLDCRLGDGLAGEGGCYCPCRWRNRLERNTIRHASTTGSAATGTGNTGVSGSSGSTGFGATGGTTGSGSVSVASGSDMSSDSAATQITIRAAEPWRPTHSAQAVGRTLSRNQRRRDLERNARR